MTHPELSEALRGLASDIRVLQDGYGTQFGEIESIRYDLFRLGVVCNDALLETEKVIRGELRPVKHAPDPNLQFDYNDPIDDPCYTCNLQLAQLARCDSCPEGPKEPLT